MLTLEIADRKHKKKNLNIYNWDIRRGDLRVCSFLKTIGVYKFFFLGIRIGFPRNSMSQNKTWASTRYLRTDSCLWYCLRSYTPPPKYKAKDPFSSNQDSIHGTLYGHLRPFMAN